MDDSARISVEPSSSKTGFTSLHEACRQSCMARVCVMVDGGFEVNVLDTKFETPLHVAASLDNADIVKKLLSKGASVNVKNIDGNTPLHLAVSSTNSDIVQLLLERSASVNALNDAKLSPLHIAIAKGYKKVVMPMLDRGADIHLRSVTGQTALHIAAAHWNAILGEQLLERGADVNARDSRGRTALHVAVSQVDLTMMGILLQRGADINLADVRGRSPLHLAARLHSCRVVQRLLDHRPLMNPCDRQGRTPLHLAVLSGHLATVHRLLRSKNTMLEVQDVFRCTPLQYAARSDHVSLLMALLSRGVSVPAVIFTDDSITETSRAYLVTHMFKLQLVGLIDEPSLHVHDDFRELRHQCELELQRLRTETFQDTVLFDIFTKYNKRASIFGIDYHDLNCYEKALGSINYSYEFPMFAIILRATLCRSLRREHLLQIANFLLVGLLLAARYPELPPAVMDRIVSCLGDEDLQSVIVSAEALVRESDRCLTSWIKPYVQTYFSGEKNSVVCGL